MKIYLSGWILKILAVLAKVAFIFLVVEKAPPGMFSEFFLLVTLGVFFSRFLSASAEEQIPVLIGQGKVGVAGANAFVICWTIVTFAIVVGCFLLGTVKYVYLIASAFCFSVSLSVLIGGIVRVSYPFLYEVSSNVPHILFIIFVIVGGVDSATGLVLSLAVSYGLVSIIVFWVYLQHSRNLTVILKLDLAFIFARKLYSSWREWLQKSISSSFILVNLRYYVLIPSFFGVKSDSIALAISVGEIFWQFVMVAANRKLSFYFREVVDINRCLKDTLSMVVMVPFVAFVSVAFVYVSFGALDFFGYTAFLQRFDISYVYAAVVASVTFSSFSFYRVLYVYMERQGEKQMPSYIFIQVLMVAFGGMAYCVSFSMEVWVLLFGGFVNYLVPLTFLLFYKRKFA